jgi:hypothetical protein
MEMHILAYVYRWERDTLWKLPFNERKMWVKMIQDQKETEQRMIERGKTVRR